MMKRNVVCICIHARPAQNEYFIDCKVHTFSYSLILLLANSITLEPSCLQREAVCEDKGRSKVLLHTE